MMNQNKIQQRIAEARQTRSVSLSMFYHFTSRLKRGTLLNLMKVHKVQKVHLPPHHLFRSQNVQSALRVRCKCNFGKIILGIIYVLGSIAVVQGDDTDGGRAGVGEDEDIG